MLIHQMLMALFLGILTASRPHFCWMKSSMLHNGNPAYLLPFEVKYRSNPQLDKKSGLGIYCASENPKQGYLVTQRDADFAVTELKGIDTMFLKIPAYILCYLLGQSERLLWG
jgi:hypothetical protein